jgi:hypothetical protein
MIDGSRLVMSEGPQPDQTFVLDHDRLTIGRDPNNDIVINDPQVSRQHARIRRQGGLTVIEDMGSTNGTFVNGMRLANPHTLANGDSISLGDAVTLTYHEAAIATTEPLGGRPTIAGMPPSYEPPPAPPPAYISAPPPPSPAASPPAVRPGEETQSKRWVLVGCVLLVLLAVAACVGVFVLDYLGLLPATFYEPLRWLGLI